MSEFQALLKNLSLHLGWPESVVSKEGLDVDFGNGSLHIRHKDGMITIMMPVDVESLTPVFSDMSVWPSVNISQLENGSHIIWCREWLDKLDFESTENCVSSLLRLRLEMLEELQHNQVTLRSESKSRDDDLVTLPSFRV